MRNELSANMNIPIIPVSSSPSGALPGNSVNMPGSVPIPPVELKERREATDCANTEFNRVKRAKLENERLKYRRTHPAANDGLDEKAEKQLDRERANRASAAASRAKIVCYARELEKRTDRLERERNAYAVSSEKAIKKLGTLKDETKKLKDVLRNLWELKDPKTCSYLVDSNALFLLANKDKDEEEEEDEKAAIHDDGNKEQQHQPAAVPVNSGATDRNHHPQTNTQSHPYYPSVLPPPTNATPAIAQRSASPAEPPQARPRYPPQQHPHPPPRLVPLGQIHPQQSQQPSSAALLGPLPGVSPRTTPAAVTAPSSVGIYSTAPPVPYAPIPTSVAPYAYAPPATSIAAVYQNHRQPYVLAPPVPREPPLASPFYPTTTQPAAHNTNTIRPMQVHPEEERRRLQQHQQQQANNQQRR